MSNQILDQDNFEENGNTDNNMDKTTEQNQLILPDSNDMAQVKTQNNKKVKKVSLLTISIIFVLIFAFIITYIIFSIINNNDTTIRKGVSIEDIDVSGLTKDEARYKIQTEFLDQLDDTIYFQYGENVYSLALEQINVEFKLEDAIQKAYNIGRIGSLFSKNIEIYNLKKHPVNIKIDVTYDEIALDACIINMSAKLPEQVEQPAYYIEDGKLIITSGKVGKAASNEETQTIVREALNNKDYNDKDIPKKTVHIV